MAVLHWKQGWLCDMISLLLLHLSKL